MHLLVWMHHEWLCTLLQTAADADLKAAGVREKHAAAELARLKKAAAKQDSASAKLEQVRVRHNIAAPSSAPTLTMQELHTSGNGMRAAGLCCSADGFSCQCPCSILLSVSVDRLGLWCDRSWQLRPQRWKPCSSSWRR